MGLVLLFTNPRALGATMLMNKPYFKLGLSSVGCAYEVRINDVPISWSNDGLPENVEMPVNQWMRSGENEVSFHIRQLEDIEPFVQGGQSCKVNATLKVEPSDSMNSKALGGLSYESPVDKILPEQTYVLKSSASGNYVLREQVEADKSGDIDISPVELAQVERNGKTEVIVKRRFRFKANLPNWSWFRSDKIADTEQTREELLKQYQKINNLIEAKDVESITPLFKERTKEYAEAFYESEVKMSVPRALENKFNDSDYKYVPLVPEDYQYLSLEVFGYGHLAKLIVTWNRGEIIFFQRKGEESGVAYSIIFRKQGDKWIITR